MDDRERLIHVAPGLASKVTASLHSSVVGNKRDARALMKSVVGDLIGDAPAAKVFHLSAANFSSSRLRGDEAVVSHAFLVAMCRTQEASRRGIELGDLEARSTRFDKAVTDMVRSRASARARSARSVRYLSACARARFTG